MNHPIQTSLPSLSNELSGLSLSESIELLSRKFPNEVTFSTSFSLEDQIIAHVILSNHLDVHLFTLDTGRLFAETYSVWESTNQCYGAKIKAYFPDHNILETYLNQVGPNDFYNSVDSRKRCCHIRKVEPLKRALKDRRVWITGIRSEHSAERKALKVLDWDESNQIIKFNPLLDWTSQAVRAFIDEHNVPYNPLHDAGFVSIGCKPCTRAIRPGEDIRAGRWWWEQQEKKECGLHSG